MTDERTCLMANAASEVRRALTEEAAVMPGTPIIAACSGGVDSVALVHLLAMTSDDFPLVHVLFIDHQLRDSTAERAAARDAAKSVDCPFTALTVRVDERGNRQENASLARYEALRRFAQPLNALVATGHTASDQAETILQRLLRRSGLLGLTGIWPRRGRFVRPLLALPRATLDGLGYPYAEDPTNATEMYQRNRLRHRVLPRLQEEDESAVVALATSAQLLQGEWRLIQWLLESDALQQLDAATIPEELHEVWARWVERPKADRRQATTVKAQADHMLVIKDPRHTVVAPSFGTYGTPLRRLTIQRSELALHSSMHDVTHRFETAEPRLTWPLTLHANGVNGSPLLTDGLGVVHPLLGVRHLEERRRGIVHVHVSVHPV